MDIDHVKDIRFSAAPPINDGKVWSEAEKQLLAEYFNGCMDITEIAWNLGRTELAVAQQLQKEGLFPRKRYGQGNKTQCLCSKCGQKETCTCSPRKREKTICKMEGEGTAHV